MKITRDDKGNVTLLYEQGDPLENAIIMTASIRKGTWWYDPAFGLDLEGVRKNSKDAPDKVRERVEAAMSWIVEAGLARSVTARARRTGDNSIYCRVDAIAPDGAEKTFEKLIEVI